MCKIDDDDCPPALYGDCAVSDADIPIGDGAACPELGADERSLAVPLDGVHAATPGLLPCDAVAA